MENPHCFKLICALLRRRIELTPHLYQTQTLLSLSPRFLPTPSETHTLIAAALAAPASVSSPTSTLCLWPFHGESQNLLSLSGH
ncbi:hypothetical protein WN943_018014 [Citrus x changshan-huyou]